MDCSDGGSATAYQPCVVPVQVGIGFHVRMQKLFTRRSFTKVEEPSELHPANIVTKAKVVTMKGVGNDPFAI